MRMLVPDILGEKQLREFITSTKRDLDNRLLAYAAAVVRTVELLPRYFAGSHVGRQLFRSGTSAGANYQEAQAAESRNDFLHKLQVALKELRESLYWLRLLDKTGALPKEKIGPTLDEAGQLLKILSKCVVTAKANSKPKQANAADNATNVQRA